VGLVLRRRACAGAVVETATDFSQRPLDIVEAAVHLGAGGSGVGVISSPVFGPLGVQPIRIAFELLHLFAPCLKLFVVTSYSGFVTRGSVGQFGGGLG
jgi:hypothetical protein